MNECSLGSSGDCETQAFICKRRPLSLPLPENSLPVGNISDKEGTGSEVFEAFHVETVDSAIEPEVHDVLDVADLGALGGAGVGHPKLVRAEEEVGQREVQDDGDVGRVEGPDQRVHILHRPDTPVHLREVLHVLVEVRVVVRRENRVQTHCFHLQQHRNF